MECWFTEAALLSLLRQGAWYHDAPQTYKIINTCLDALGPDGLYHIHTQMHRCTLGHCQSKSQGFTLDIC